MTEQHEFDMALTMDDFVRLLPVAVASTFSRDGDTFHGNAGAVAWRITLTPLPKRRIALLAMPRLHVRIELAGATSEELVEFMRRFHLGFQRAGG